LQIFLRPEQSVNGKNVFFRRLEKARSEIKKKERHEKTGKKIGSFQTRISLGVIYIERETLNP